jgi:hypothetical protein
VGVGTSWGWGDGSGVDANDCNSSSVLLESNDSLSCCAKLASGMVTCGFTLLNENGLGKSKGSPKRELDFAFGNSSAGWFTGTWGVDAELVGMVSSASGG